MPASSNHSRITLSCDQGVTPPGSSLSIARGPRLTASSEAGSPLDQGEVCVPTLSHGQPGTASGACPLRAGVPRGEPSKQPVAETPPTARASVDHRQPAGPHTGPAAPAGSGRLGLTPHQRPPRLSLTADFLQARQDGLRGDCFPSSSFPGVSILSLLQPRLVLGSPVTRVEMMPPATLDGSRSKEEQSRELSHYSDDTVIHHSLNYPAPTGALLAGFPRDHEIS